MMSKKKVEEVECRALIITREPPVDEKGEKILKQESEIVKKYKTYVGINIIDDGNDTYAHIFRADEDINKTLKDMKSCHKKLAKLFDDNKLEYKLAFSIQPVYIDKRFVDMGVGFTVSPVDPEIAKAIEELFSRYFTELNVKEQKETNSLFFSAKDEDFVMAVQITNGDEYIVVRLLNRKKKEDFMNYSENAKEDYKKLLEELEDRLLDWSNVDKRGS